MSTRADIADLVRFRGRASRTGLVAVAGLLLAADVAAGLVVYVAGASLTGPGMLVFKALSLWLATAAVAKRLHDLDLGAAWLAKGFAALILWALVVAIGLVAVFGAEKSVDPNQTAFWLNACLVSLPVLVAIVWLHVVPGSDGANRFGPPPGASGFSRAGGAPRETMRDTLGTAAGQPA